MRRIWLWPVNHCTRTGEPEARLTPSAHLQYDEGVLTPMSTSVTLPALGESVTEGTVSRWLKQVGDTVEADEALLEVSTDKVDTEIPSPTSGVLLEIRAQEDETVEVGAVLAVIGEASEAPSGGGAADSDDGGAAEPEPAQPRRHPSRRRFPMRPRSRRPTRHRSTRPRLPPHRTPLAPVAAAAPRSPCPPSGRA